jgi:hypothetical protein
MKHNRWNLFAVAALSAIALAAAVVAEDFEISRATVDGGGVMHCTGGDYEFSGTIGQPDAGTMSGDDFVLTGGFWFSVSPGDGNEDGAVDLVDFDVFNVCLLGPIGGLDTGCDHYDSDGSGHIDLRDFADFQQSFTGGS